MDIIRASPIIPFSTISLFILLCGIGGSMLIILKNNHIEDKRLIATDYAHLMVSIKAYILIMSLFLHNFLSLIAFK